LKSTAAIKCVIVDDEEIDRILLSSYIIELPQLHLVAACANHIEALEVIKREKPQIVFLDIDMPEISGLELLKIIRNEIPVCILESSHPE
jgi:two-component system LytT family response regulator